MKVLMISGDNQVVRNINGPFALTLRELSKNWQEIDVLCPGVSGFNRIFNNNVSLFGVRKFLLPLDLFAQMQKKKYDLIVSHDYGLMLNGLNAALMSKIFNIPHISEIHHIEGYPRAVSLKEHIYAQIGMLYVRSIGKMCKAIRIDNLGNILKLLLDSGIPRHQIAYLPPIYLELDKYHPLSIPKTIDLLFVGRLATNKGIFTILETAKTLKNKGYHFKIYLKGRGPLEEEIKIYIKKYNLQDSIHLDCRILDEKDLITLYNKAKILVCASTVEGGPRVTLEAMACQTPVISTPCGIMPEVIENGINGYLFDGTSSQLTELVIKILQDETTLNKISKCSREAVIKYDYHNTLKNYATTYRTIVGL